MTAYTFPLLSIFWTMLVFFGFVVFIWLMIVLIIDVFRSRDLRGWAKALWFLFLLCLPVVGVVTYLIVRGGSMHERGVQRAEEQQQAFDAYVRATTSGRATTSNLDELTKLADLRDKGVVSEAEFNAQKARLLGWETPVSAKVGDGATSP